MYYFIFWLEGFSKTTKIAVRTARVPSVIQTEHLLNSSITAKPACSLSLFETKELI
jgi:hypothetical protein